MPNFIRQLALLLLSGLSVSSAFAQIAQGPPQVTFQVDVDYIDVDVAVTDEQGEFVRGHMDRARVAVEKRQLPWLVSDIATRAMSR